mgnify:CR=1 FL=1
MLLSYGAFLFFALNYPTPWRGRNSKDCFPTGPFFFTLNQPEPVGADEINIPPPAAGGIVKIVFLRGLSFLSLITPGLTARDNLAPFELE